MVRHFGTTSGVPRGGLESIHPLKYAAAEPERYAQPKGDPHRGNMFIRAGKFFLISLGEKTISAASCDSFLPACRPVRFFGVVLAMLPLDELGASNNYGKNRQDSKEDDQEFPLRRARVLGTESRLLISWCSLLAFVATNTQPQVTRKG